MIGRRDWIPDGAVKRLAVLTFLTGLVVALIGFLEPVASASPVQHPQTRVAAIEHATTQLVGPHETVLPGGSRPRAPNYDSSATGSSVAAEGDTSIVYRYVSDGEKVAAENSGYIPNTDLAGSPKSVFYSPDEYSSASEAERALQIGSENPGGSTASPTWRLTASSDGATPHASNVSAWIPKTDSQDPQIGYFSL